MAFNIIDFVFAHQHEIEQAVYEYKNDKGGHTGGNGTGHSRISDPTAMEGIRLAEEVICVSVEYGLTSCGKRDVLKLKYPERWLKVIYWTKQDRPTHEIKALELSYKRIPPEEAKDILHVSRAYYYALAENARTYAAGLAKGIGALSVYKKSIGEHPKIE